MINNFILDNISFLNNIIDDNLNNFIRYINLLDNDLIYEIRNKLMNKYENKILKLIKYEEILKSKELILSSYIEIFKNYKNEINSLIFSSYIAFKLDNFIEKIDKNKSIENLGINKDYIDIEDLYFINTYLKNIRNRKINFFSNKQKTLKNKLLNNQEEILERIINNGIKNILIAETGSGKTIISIAYAEFLYYNMDINNIIVIVERNEEIYIAELNKHLNNYFDTNKYRIMTYYNMFKQLDTNKDYDETLFILDEIHLLKNKTIRSDFIKKLNIKNFLGLTATIVDKEKDLKTLFSNLNLDNDNANTLLEKYVLRMKKDNIEKKLKQIRIEIETPEEIMKELSEITYNDDKVLLQNISKAIIKTAEIKLYDIFKICTEHNDDIVIVFCEFLSTQKLIYNYIKNLIPNKQIVKINGNTLNNKKNEIIKQFNNGEIDILISTSVLSTSYNLQKSNVIINTEQSYSVIKRIQKIGRIDRIGQDKDSYFYDLIPKNTIEDKILRIIDDKKEFLTELNNSLEKRNGYKKIEDDIKITLCNSYRGDNHE